MNKKNEMESWPGFVKAIYCKEDKYKCDCPSVWSSGRQGNFHSALVDGRLPKDVSEIGDWLVNAGNKNLDGRPELMDAIRSLIKPYKSGLKWVHLQKKEKEHEEYFNTNYELIGNCIHISKHEDVQKNFYQQTEYIVFGKTIWRKKDE